MENYCIDENTTERVRQLIDNWLDEEDAVEVVEMI